MASTQEHIRALDQLRQRLSQLNASISALKIDLERNEPLPTWSHLQSAAAALSFNLQQLTSTFQTHAKFLKEAHAYPLPTFPGLSQEGLLEQLLRKKLEPGAEDWIETYTSKFDAQAAGGEEGGLGRQELRELWDWAAPASTGIVRPMLEDGLFEDDFTVAEREAGVEKVATGLRRKLDGQDDEDEDDSKDDEEDRMEDVMPSAPAAAVSDEDVGIDATLSAVPIDNLFRLTSTGVVPTTTVLPKR